MRNFLVPIVGLLWAVVAIIVAIVVVLLNIAIRGVVLALILLAAYGFLTLLGVVPPIDLPLIP